jgi:hypothetical protein
MKKILLVLCCVVLQCFWNTEAKAADPVIEVYGINIGGTTIYRYRVVNKTNVPIVALTLGLDEVTGEGLFPRTDWILDADKPDPVAASRCKPFANKTCYAGIVIDSEYYNAYVEVRAQTDTPPDSVQAKGVIAAAGQTSDWMELTVQQPHQNYLSSKGNVSFLGNYVTSPGKKKYELPLNFVVFDTAAPSVSGSVARTVASGVITAKAALTISDNLDPNPQVRLISVTSNQTLASGDVQATLNADTRTVKLKQKAGRTYTLNYTVTDGSNNTKALALTVQGS